MRKRLISALLLIALLWCTPSFRMDLMSDAHDIPAGTRTLPPAAPEPEEAPVVNDGVYTLSLTSSVGLLTYYNQKDSRWGKKIYGGQDSIGVYGCGPTALAMIVSSFTEQTVLPPDMSKWAADKGYWSAGSGTKHEFILEGAKSFGFQAKSFKKYTKEDVLAELSSGHILVALMGPGHLTSSGHFIIINDYWSGSKVSIADPASLENTQKPWEIQMILDELLYGANGGGPLWSIAPE